MLGALKAFRTALPWSRVYTDGQCHAPPQRDVSSEQVPGPGRAPLAYSVPCWRGSGSYDVYIFFGMGGVVSHPFVLCSRTKLRWVICYPGSQPPPLFLRVQRRTKLRWVLCYPGSQPPALVRYCAGLSRYEGPSPYFVSRIFYGGCRL